MKLTLYERWRSMRGKVFVKLLILMGSTLAGLVIVQLLTGAFGTSATNNTKGDKAGLLLAEIAKYRQWTLVNPTPVLMAPQAALQCIIDFDKEPNPHERSYVSVFVNPKGASAMMTEARPVFPEGSIIVKEKLSSEVSQKPTLLTAMVKRKKGYNPKSRDWEYLVLDGPASQILERGKLARCNGCHTAYEDTDFVTRHYLPSMVHRHLR